MPISIRISLAQQQTFELTCGTQSRRVDWKSVESLAAAADRDYFGDDHASDPHWAPKLPQLIAQGQSLYQWLDGPQGWLRTGLVNGETALLLDLAEPLQAQDHCACSSWPPLPRTWNPCSITSARKPPSSKPPKGSPSSWWWKRAAPSCS